MLLHLEIAPEVRFITTSASVGISDAEAQAMRERKISNERVNFIWAVIKNASVYLMNVPPRGSC